MWDCCEATSQYIYVVHLDRQSKVQCVNWYIQTVQNAYDS